MGESDTLPVPLNLIGPVIRDALTLHKTGKLEWKDCWNMAALNLAKGINDKA